MDNLNETKGLIPKTIAFCLDNTILVIIATIFILGWGVMVAPFDWDVGGLPRDPVPVDAIPDIGENQQIVFTKWMGRSPQDIEDQVGYPLTVSLLGIPGVKTIRSYSMLGFSTIYVIFKEKIDFYWSRSRVLEKLSSLPMGVLPGGVRPTLGPDATALGQIFWYTLEGQDENGNQTGGWDLHELRTIQDWYVRYGLLSADGISEVASIGGFVKEYQIDVDPDALRAYKVNLQEVVMAIKQANLDVGARTIEVNKVEYLIRGIGFFKSIEDVENSVIKMNSNVPIYVKNVAKVGLGPALRRGALDKGGAEAVGGVVVARYGDNPLAAIKNVKKKIKEISPGLPKKTLADGTVSQVKVVPFYDRSGLIYETLGTLKNALTEEILITIIVILVMLMNFKSSMLITGSLPLVVLMCFIAMKNFGVDANIVALSGIAIAIGTIVDMGIVVCENIIKHLDQAPTGVSKRDIIFNATAEVGSAILTAVSTTIVSFLPVFTMEAAEGKLFRPLAFTKTFALLASIIVALTIIPSVALILFGNKKTSRFSLFKWLEEKMPTVLRQNRSLITNGLAVLIVTYILTGHWLPLGPEKGFILNFILVSSLIGILLGLIFYFQNIYESLLRWCLDNKGKFLILPTFIIVLGSFTWLGFDTFFGWLPRSLRSFAPISYIAHSFPGLGKEFMPPLDEGSYLYMPTTMPHASISESMDVLVKQDIRLDNIAEIDSVVGKLGRAETPLDPAPISMIETIINYKPKYVVDKNGNRIKFKYNPDQTETVKDFSGNELLAPDGRPYMVHGKYIRDKSGRLIKDKSGIPFRQWRAALDPKINTSRSYWRGIQKPDDIWQEIIKATKIPGTTSAPRLQPISARIVMLQSGMRAPMGVKIKGPTLKAIELAGFQIEKLLKQVPSVEASAVFADRIVGKPYLEINIDRKAIARYGIKLKQVQDIIEVAIGGKQISTTLEGRERYPIRVRYQRELRDSIDALGKILVAAPGGVQVPLKQLSKINYVQGPQVIKSEDTFLVGYVLLDKKPGFAEVDVVNQSKKYLDDKIKSGEFKLPAGVSFTFAGSYENQVRSEKKLMIVLPLALFIIFMILYFQFKDISTTGLVFSGIVVAWAGGFILLWLYGKPWFFDFSFLGMNLRELFQIRPLNLSVAVWVGFLALFGIASDNGVIIATYLDQVFLKNTPKSIHEIREATIQAGVRRVRPCLMTTATTILALIPVLTSSGRGADVMVPMAIPSFGGMLLVIITIFVVPVLYCLIKEIRFNNNFNLSLKLKENP
ncbi:MAG: efflux RND transporter permease subunit [Bacteriovoracaceae bacterium]|nr:efflux RND transporter permease subunit [Bacteriovoracaceae bacterium]